jgi:DNA-binding transcriptional MerR regulator
MSYPQKADPNSSKAKAAAEPDSVIRAFSADHVIGLTGLSKSQLRYWDQTGFFSPQYASEARHVPYRRIYSFKDVVGLRTLAVLRKDHGISLQHLRQVAEKLSDHDQSLWSEVKLYVLQKQVYFTEPGSDTAINTDGQLAAVVLLKDIMNDMAERVRKLRERAPDQIGRIDRHRYVVHNAWVIAGTRIPTRAIRNFRDAGCSIEKILKEYPVLTRQDVEAALEHEEQLAKSA